MSSENLNNVRKSSPILILKQSENYLMIFRTKSPSLSKGNLLPLEPVEVSHAYALEEGNHQKGNVGAAKTIIRDEYSCEEYSEGKRLRL